MNHEYIKTRLLFINNQVYILICWMYECWQMTIDQGWHLLVEVLRQHIMKNYLGVFVLQSLMEKIDHIWLLINKKLGICLIYMETYISNMKTRCNRQSSAIYYLADPLTIGLNNIDSVTDTTPSLSKRLTPPNFAHGCSSLVSLNEV